MAETVIENEMEIADGENLSRVYEIGYHVSPATKEGEVDAVVSEIRALIEKEGGRLLAEGAPSLTKFSYNIAALEAGKRVEYDRGYFGWIKFEGPTASAAALEEALKLHTAILRSIVFRTVREETRARFKTQGLRDVKRTDTLKAAPRAVEESAAPVSEADLEKALQDITAE
jgi:ribosomal protein S6